MAKKESNKIISIAIDGNEANVTQRVGSNAYAFELLHALERITRNRTDIGWVVLLSTEAVADLPKSRKGWQYQVVKPRVLWTQWALPLYLFRHSRKFDIFFTPGHYAPRVCPIPYVSSVMDLAFLSYPKQFRKKDLLQLKFWTAYSVRGAKKIIAISEFTKKDVMKRYGKSAQDVVVAYPALTVAPEKVFSEYQSKKILRELSTQQPYLLYVGTLQPRKNVVRLIEAFESILEKNQVVGKQKNAHRLSEFQQLVGEVKLVIAGKVGWLAEDIVRRAQESRFAQRIVLTGYVTDEQKAVLYRNSLATVLVGLYEGFGIPALEAMAMGSIPIVSSTTSLPEVVGDAGMQVPPTKVSAIADALLELLNFSAKERAILLKKGRVQQRKFSWEKTAGQVLKTLQEVATYDK